jgi:hypothetical protein
MGPYMAEGFLRKGTRRISSWPGETTLHKKAGYIDAGFLPLNTFPLQSDGGPYIPVTSESLARRRWSLTIERLPNLPHLGWKSYVKDLGFANLENALSVSHFPTAWTTVEFLASPVRNDSRSVPYWNLSTRPLEDAYAAAGELIEFGGATKLIT